MRYVVFLRGINVSGQKLIKMEELRKHFALPGFTNIATYIQSGNILFDTAENDEASLLQKIENQLQYKLGYRVPAVIRSLAEIEQVIARNPFHDIGSSDERKLYVTFCAAAPMQAVQLLDNYLTPPEQLHLAGRDLYMLTTSYGNSKLSNNIVEKKLGVTATTRNWATVNKVLSL